MGERRRCGQGAPACMGLQCPQPRNGSKMQTAQQFPGRVRLWEGGGVRRRREKPPSPPGLQNEKTGAGARCGVGVPQLSTQPTHCGPEWDMTPIQVWFHHLISPPITSLCRAGHHHSDLPRGDAPLPACTPLAVLFSGTFPTHTSTRLPPHLRLPSGSPEPLSRVW